MNFKDNVMCGIMLILIGALLAFFFFAANPHVYTEDQLNAVGIKAIRKCSIDTPTAKSNWVEIVWMDGFNRKGERK